MQNCYKNIQLNILHFVFLYRYLIEKYTIHFVPSFPKYDIKSPFYPIKLNTINLFCKYCSSYCLQALLRMFQNTRNLWVLRRKL